MQNDTGRTFEEIYGSAEALLAAIEEIERVALKERSDNAPVRVRLLTPYGDDSFTNAFAITPIESLQGDEIYVAVSYAWAHEQSTAGLQIPNYLIRDLSKPDEPPRPPRCPPPVFHRAMQYAKTKGYSYVWIDQECIYQNNDADRERHLQLMHRIYRASAVTIAVLSIPMVDPVVFEQFAEWSTVDKQPREEPQALPAGVLADWLMTMTSDRWFTRAWTMQEKLCSARMEYLIPMSTCNPSPTASKYQHLIINNDLAVNLLESVANFDMMTSPEPGILSAYQRLGKWLHPSNATPDSLVRNIEFALYEIGPRENSITSDRLAILANVCNLPYTLSTTVLRDLRVSYRTCLLVLTFANVWPDAGERRVKYRQFAFHDTGQSVTPTPGTVDEILEEFIKRPRIDEDMEWIHYHLESEQDR